MKTKTLTHAQEAIENLILQKLTPAYNMAWGEYDDYNDYNDAHGDYYDVDILPDGQIGSFYKRVDK